MTAPVSKPLQKPIPVRLSNRWATFRCSPEIQNRLKEHFRFHPPGYEFSERYRTGAWDGWANLMARGRVASGLFLARREDLEKQFRLVIEDERTSPKLRTATTADLRPYQAAGLEAMAKADCGGIILAATGSGKTRLAGAYFRRLRGKALFIVDELSLLEQSRRAIEEFLREKVGVVGRGQFRPRRITVATVQTLHRHREDKEYRDWFAELDAVVVDELHQELNDRLVSVVQKIRPPAVFGMTATLQMDLPHVWMPAVALCGPVIYRYPISTGVEEGYLSRGIVCALGFRDPLRGTAPAYPTMIGGKREWIKAGSPQAEYRRHVSLNSARNDLVEAVVREGIRIGRRVVVLVEQRPHLRMLSARFERAGIQHGVACGGVAPELRLEAMRRMDAGKLALILATRVFAKGVDIRTVDMIVDATRMPSLDNALQRYGRGARKAEGKRGLIYVDVADRGSRYAAAARERLKSLRETGSPVLEIMWEGNAEEILKKCLQKLPD